MLDIEDTALLVIDMQGKLAGVMHDHERLVDHLQRMIKAAIAFDLPVLWTEQAPDKIGATIDPIRELLFPLFKPISKRSFSAYDCPAFVDHLRAVGRRQILVTGIETGVCVYQTAHDLHRFGYEVHVVSDAVSSRKQHDRDFAIERMRDEGIIITTAEMAVCELLKTADHPKFKEIMVNVKR